MQLHQIYRATLLQISILPGMVLFTSAAVAAPEDSSRLFKEIGREEFVSAAEPVKSKRKVTVNLKTLGAPHFIVELAGQDLEASSTSAEVSRTMKGFESTIYKGVLRINSLRKGNFVVASTTSPSAERGLYGIFDIAGKSFVLTLTGSDTVIIETDQLKLPPCGGGKSVPVDSTNSDESAVQSDNVTIAAAQSIDVMVVYSPQARAAVGSTANMLALINTAIAGANQAYIDSLIDQRLRLVHTLELSKPDSGNMNTDLSWLQSTADGSWDEVHSLRNEYGADLVSAIVSTSNYCGLAYLNSGSTHAFSVVGHNCISAMSFVHELGHNMGAAHDKENVGTAGFYTYSYGWRFNGSSGALFRTIMAYAPGDRIGYFSSPLVSYDGTPTGVANIADNARTLNQRAATMAGFRSAKLPSPATNLRVVPN